ncbi:MAG: hypothetical protein J6C90_02975, partial [Clostridia bacterium]|nr:hypothetical protein [Clostridia bacterium]
MQPTYYGHHRRNLTITMIVSLIVVVAFVAGIFAIFGKSPEIVTPAVIGSKIDKRLGGGRKLLNADVWDGSTTGAIWTNGSGTEADPYLIESAANLVYLRRMCSSSNNYRDIHFKLMTNIDLNNVAWAGIKWFNGTFDGNNYTLYNVKLTYQRANTGSSYQYSYGIFTTGTGDILNLNVVHSAPPVLHTETSGTSGGSVYYWIGGLSAKTSGKIQNCKVTNFVLDDLPESVGYCGGILGSGGADIIDCVVEGFYYNDSEGSNGAGAVGGAAGECFGDITNLKVVDTIISATSTYLGGAVGDSFTSTTGISKRWSNISVDAEIISSNNAYVGGVAGRLNAVSLSKARFSGSISAIPSRMVGGIVGYASTSDQAVEDEWYVLMGRYSECLFDGEITISGEISDYSTLFVGGIIGRYDGDSYDY